MYALSVVRYAVATLLLVLLAPLFALALLAFELDGALTSSAFYKERLREANLYAFLLNDVAEAAIDEARELPPPDGMTENPLDATGLSTARIVNSLNRAIPPGWLQAQTERNLDQIIPYFAGDSDRFTLGLSVNERVPQLIAEGGVLVENANVHAIIFDVLLTAELDALHRVMTESGLDMDQDRLERAVSAIVSEEWTSQQAAALYYEIAPYVMGRTDSFQARLRLDGLRSPLSEELRTVAREIDWRPILSRHAIDPILRQGQDRSLRLIRGLDLPQSEIMSILAESVTQAQYEAAADDAVAELAAYLFGDSESPTVAIDLTDLKRESRPRLAELARRTANARANALPPCASGERWQPSATFVEVFPSCLPAEPQARNAMQRWLSEFNAGMDAHIESAVIRRMPDTLILTENNFWTALDNGGVNITQQSVAQLRDLLTNGVAFTSHDLKASLESELGANAVQSLENVRSFFRDGIEITQADFITRLPPGVALPGTPNPTGGWYGYAPLSQADPIVGASIEWDIESMRSDIQDYSAARWMLAAIFAGLLLIFAALMPSGCRIVWTVGCMAFVSAFAFVLLGPMYALLVESQIGSYIACDLSMFSPPLPDDFTRTPILLCGKFFEIGIDSINAIVRGAALKAALSMAAFGLLTLGALILLRLHPRAAR